MDQNTKNDNNKSHFKINNSNQKPVKPKLNFPPPSNLNLKPRRSQNISNYKINKIENKVKSIINQKEIDSHKFPQDTKETPKDSSLIENGDKKIQKQAKKKMSLRSYKRASTLLEKNNNLLKSQQIPKISINSNKQNKIIDINNTERNEILIDTKKENENGFDPRRSMTPKKNSKDIKIVAFDSIEKEKILEPKIIESIEKQISKCDLEELQSIYESFFIASIPKGEYSFAEDINNSGEAYCSNKLGQCGHDFCLKLPPYKGSLIFQYPPKEKDIQNFQISELFISLCFPYGIKVCYGNFKENRPELYYPKKTSDFCFVTTNGNNERNYVYVYNFYIKLDLEKFKTEYKCDPIKTYLNLLIKNQDKNLQTNFEECQYMINSSCVFIPHIACLVSKYPYIKEMKKCIYSILKLRKSEEDLSKFLKNIIYEIPDINNFKTFDLQLNYFTPYSIYPIVLKSKYFNRGINLDLNDISILFDYFQIQLLLKIFKLMLTSQKLLFVVKDSSEYQNLCIITLSLLNILYPFKWKYTYITILSINMLQFLQSFLPFIMGIDSNMIEYAKNNYIEKQNNITIIYLRKNRKSFIETENPDENANIEIPSELREMLINDLQKIKKIYEKDILKLSKLGNSTPFIQKEKGISKIKLGEKIREVFLKFFVEIFGDYQEYTSSIDETAYFNIESFLNNVPKIYHNFYLSIFNSEMFHDFLQRNVVVNSPLYRPDRYYNKYCIREKKGYNILKTNDFKKFHFKKKKTFLNDDFNISSKQSYNIKQSPKKEINRTLIHKTTVNPSVFKSTNLIPQFQSKLNNTPVSDSSSNINNNNIQEEPENIRAVKTQLFTNANNDISNENSINLLIEENQDSNSLDSSFNEDSLKNLVSNRISNKYIIPPCFLKIDEKELSELTMKKIEKMIYKYYGESNLMKQNEFDREFIFDSLPIINYQNLSIAKKEDLEKINRYILPSEINKESALVKRYRRNTLTKSMRKEEKFDPKIIQLEDCMKEILSSSGENAINLLFPNGIKEVNINNLNDIVTNGQIKEGERVEKENGGSLDKPLRKISQNIGNKDHLSMTDFQKNEIRRHFAFILFQNKDNAYQSNILSTNRFNILSKLIFNVFLYTGNKTVDDFQVCRALIKSMYLYYKKNTKGKKIFLYHYFNKVKTFDIWKDKAFWNYYYEREIENHNEKNDNSKFDVLISISSIMNDLHFAANTQVDIIIDSIAKKEIKDKDLVEVLFKTIIKQYNNRVVVAASMDN